MKEKKILPLVLSMSLPMVISMAVNSLYNIVDSYFVAKLNEEAMTALSLVYPVQNMINASQEDVGRYFNKDRTTVLYSIREVESRMHKNPAFAESVKEIKTNIYSSH